MSNLQEWIQATLAEHDAQETEKNRAAREAVKEKARIERAAITATLSKWGVPLPMEEHKWTEKGYLRFGRLTINSFNRGPEATGLNTVEDGINNFHCSAEELALFLREYLKRESDEDAFAEGSAKPHPAQQVRPERVSEMRERFQYCDYCDQRADNGRRNSKGDFVCRDCDEQ
jgi:hypothetical protein